MALQAAREPAPLALGCGTSIRTASGEVCALFTLEGFDSRTRVASYALRVVNDTAAALVCRIWVVTRRDGTMVACPGQIDVAPFSAIGLLVPLHPNALGSFDRALAEISGGDTRCIVESSPRVTRRRRSDRFSVSACITAAMLAIAGSIAGWTALRGATPQIGAFAVAPTAMSGTTVRADYVTSGLGTIEFAVTAPDGRRLQAETLRRRAGSIAVALPSSADPRGYVLELSLTGPLGSAKELRVVNALAARRITSAQIGGIQVAPVVAQAGHRIDVAYAASGDGGYLRLTGKDGTIWAQRPFSRSGAASFVAPPVTQATEMRVVLHVRKNGSSADTSAGFVAMPAAAAGAIDASSAASASATEPADAHANGTFALLTPVVPSGGSVRLDVLSPRDRMHIALMNGPEEVRSLDVGSDAAGVTLVAPVVTVPTRYTVVSTFTDGFGQESIVEPVMVRP